jgi:hypothetical protein
MTIVGTERKFRLINCHFLKVNNLAHIMELVPTLHKWIRGGAKKEYFIARFPQMTKEKVFCLLL